MNYTELKDTVVRWLNREGFQELIDETDFFMEMAQRRIARELDLHAMEVAIARDTSDTTVPADLLRTKAVFLEFGGLTHTLSYATIQQVLIAGTAARPVYYNISGNAFVYGPEPDQVYSTGLVYYAQLPVLSDTETTNWLSLNAPELILFASLLEASLFLKDDQRSSVWEGKYMQVRDELEKSDEQMDKASGDLAVRTITPTYSGSKNVY